MSIWVFHLDTVVELPEVPAAEDNYYASILFDPKAVISWWLNIVKYQIITNPDCN